MTACGAIRAQAEATSADWRLAGPRPALFLDLDGTLAPLEPRPSDVGPEPRRTALLAALSARLEGRLAIVSGRTLTEVDAILEHRVACVAAVHGLVTRGPDGTRREAAPHPGLSAAAAAFRRAAAADPRLLVEEKGLSVALHYRQAPAFETQARALAQDLAVATGLGLQTGHMVAELRTPGATKGDSVRTFMALPAFQGARPVFVGDDLTDEDGFAAAGELGGFGVLVGPPRPSGARLRLPDVAAALAWLETCP